MLNSNQRSVGAPLSNWVNTGHPTFEPGAGFDARNPEAYFCTKKLKGRFDVLIHFRDTNPTQLLH